MHGRCDCFCRPFNRQLAEDIGEHLAKWSRWLFVPFLKPQWCLYCGLFQDFLALDNLISTLSTAKFRWSEWHFSLFFSSQFVQLGNNMTETKWTIHVQWWLVHGDYILNGMRTILDNSWIIFIGYSILTRIREDLAAHLQVSWVRSVSSWTSTPVSIVQEGWCLQYLHDKST